MLTSSVFSQHFHTVTLERFTDIFSREKLNFMTESKSGIVRQAVKDD